MKIALSVSAKEKSKGFDSPYWKALIAAGARPEEIRTISAADAGGVAIEDLDGILFTGGEDVDPEFYGEATRFPSVRVDRARDKFELALLIKARKLRLPVFGICRGVQTINVGFGGTLYQDLKSETVLETNHKQTGNRSEPTHGVTVTDPDSWLHEFIGGSCRVNSLHHQAIKRLGRGLKVTAHAEDGLVEGVELAKDYPFLAGVQWHPEEMFQDYPEQLKIFKEFVSRCRARAERKPSGAA